MILKNLVDKKENDAISHSDIGSPPPPILCSY